MSSFSNMLIRLSPVPGAWGFTQNSGWGEDRAPFNKSLVFFGFADCNSSCLSLVLLFLHCVGRLGPMTLRKEEITYSFGFVSFVYL